MTTLSPSARRKIAARDFNLKLRLESKLRPELRRLNRRMTRAYMRGIAATSQSINFQDEFGDDLREILVKHYSRVGEVFTRMIDRQVMQVSIVIAEHYAIKSVEQVRVITEATQRHADEALAVARQAAQGEVAVTELEIATNSGGIFRRRLNGRETGIVMFETQHSAEAAKLTQVEILAGEEPSVVGGQARPSLMTKDWANLGDSLVRTGQFSHLAAEQTVPANRPFIVGGEKLRYPGDTSLGASPGNTQNCRCGAIYQRAA